MSTAAGEEDLGEVMDDVRSRHPRFWTAVFADARVNAAYRGERSEFRSGGDALVQVLRLMLRSDAFIGQVFYRAKAALQARGIPVLPRLAHRLAIATAQVSIGDPVVVAAGVYLVHGQVVIDGITEIGPGAVIAPFTTIGLKAGNLKGPTLEPNVNIGTGARVLGPVRLGEGCVAGANAVVIADVAPGEVVAGVPARPLGAGD
jgi:serine O-acetyltransferase